MNDVRRPLAFRALLAGLEAAGEETRLRILCLLEAAELTVSELVAILGQSQPRVSRHLRLLVEAGLATRQREGAWAFFRLAEPGATLALRVAAPARSDRSDRERRPCSPRHCARGAPQAGGGLFRRARRGLGSDPRPACAGGAGRSGARRHDRRKPFRNLLDLGTGTGRMLELLAPRATRAVGVDQSAAMLALARARIDQAGLQACLAAPGRHLRPAGRTRRLRSGGHPPGAALPRRSGARARRSRAGAGAGRAARWWSISTPHDQEFLRDEFAHRRLGFAVDEVEGYLAEAGLAAIRMERVPPAKGESGKLTVALWIAEDPRVISDDFPKSDVEFA